LNKAIAFPSISTAIPVPSGTSLLFAIFIKLGMLASLLNYYVSHLLEVKLKHSRASKNDYVSKVLTIYKDFD
jgi:hypothetical protein